MSLKPHLTRFIHVLQEQQNGVICFEIINNGVGPAFIKSFKVFMNGNLISNVESEIKNLLDDYQNTLTVINLTDDYVMKSGEKQEILKVNFNFKEGQSIQQVEELLKCLDLIIEYQSVYGTKDIFSTVSN